MDRKDKADKNAWAINYDDIKRKLAPCSLSSCVCHKHIKKASMAICTIDTCDDINKACFHIYPRGFFARVKTIDAPRCNFLVRFKASIRDDSELPEINSIYPFPSDIHEPSKEGSVAEGSVTEGAAEEAKGSVAEGSVADISLKEIQRKIRISKFLMQREKFFHLPENMKMTITIYKKMNIEYARLLLRLAFSESTLMNSLELSNNVKWEKRWLNYEANEIRVNGYLQVFLKSKNSIFYRDYLQAATKRDDEGYDYDMEQFYYDSTYDDGDETAGEKDYGLIIVHEPSKASKKAFPELVSQMPYKYIVDSKHCNKIKISMSLEDFFANYHIISFLLNEVESAPLKLT